MDQDKIDIIEEERDEVLSNDDLFNITSWGADPSVRELISQYEDGDIVKPELQRKYVWNKRTASRFIESVLLGLPVPSIFLSNEPSGKRLIIDGYQRIRTLYDYIEEGVWHGDDSVFRLINSEMINVRWRNKAFKELDEDDKRRLRQYTIHAIIFEQRQPRNDSGMFQIFERINTSGMTLTDQEIRNCVYQGSLNTLLFELNREPSWRELYGDKSEDPRMRDLELILRFFAMNTPEVYLSGERTIGLKKLLNQYMADRTQLDKAAADELRSTFTATMQFIRRSFGLDAFFNLQNDFSKLRKRLYPTVFDSLTVATAIALRNGFATNGGSLEAKRLSLLQLPDYRDSITQGTMKVENIRRRIEMALRHIYDMELR